MDETDEISHLFVAFGTNNASLANNASNRIDVNIVDHFQELVIVQAFHNNVYVSVEPADLQSSVVGHRKTARENLSLTWTQCTASPEELSVKALTMRPT